MKAADLKKGDSLYKYKDSSKYHILHVDKNEEIVVLKWFGKHKQWWHYEIMTFYDIDIRMESKPILISTERITPIQECNY